jgi:hypothetical protein
VQPESDPGQGAGEPNSNVPAAVEDLLQLLDDVTDADVGEAVTPALHRLHKPQMLPDHFAPRYLIESVGCQGQIWPSRPEPPQ